MSLSILNNLESYSPAYGDDVTAIVPSFTYRWLTISGVVILVDTDRGVCHVRSHVSGTVHIARLDAVMLVGSRS